MLPHELSATLHGDAVSLAEGELEARKVLLEEPSAEAEVVASLAESVTHSGLGVTNEKAQPGVSVSITPFSTEGKRLSSLPAPENLQGAATVTTTVPTRRPQGAKGTLAKEMESGTTLKRSNRPAAKSNEHTLKAERRAATKNLEKPGNSKSFELFSDSRICSNLNNVGISLGRDNKVISSSVVAIKT